MAVRSLDFQINERDRIGLVGDNGTGKSTLMKMIAGLAPSDEGEVIGARDLTFGYLPQDGLFLHGRTLLEEALSVFESLTELELEIGNWNTKWPRWNTPALPMSKNWIDIPSSRSSSLEGGLLD